LGQGHGGEAASRRAVAARNVLPARGDYLGRCRATEVVIVMGVFRTHRVAVLGGALLVLGAVGVAYAAGSPSPSASSTGAQHAAARPSHPSHPAKPDKSDSDESSSAPSSTPVGPDATGPAAFGLCNAYKHASVHGKSAQHSIAFRNLARAAGGAANIAAYCATIPHPGSGSPSSHPTGKPSDLPSHPSGKPSDLPSHGAGA